jgi:hypothetical protein
MRRLIFILLVYLFAAHAAPASGHPGNIFVAGEDVRMAVPAEWSTWRAIDIDGKVVGRGKLIDGKAELGKLPVGYYELREKDGGPRVTVGVVAKNEPVDDTPIAIDAGMSWLYSDAEQIRDACKLCRLGGVKWVRDRLSWPELESARGTWAAETRYERAMQIEHEAGLKILQVNHISPPWAAKNPTHFPDDLRDAYNFYRGLAKRWHGLADAIEPWNEPDLDIFGGHTGCEIASFQKAAYLGLKAGDPNLPVCEAVFAIDRAETLEEFGTNDTFPYFDRYDLHHYIGLPSYPRAYARHRAVSGGRPMWTTEFNLTVIWADEKTKEPSEEELRKQAYRVSKVFSGALHEGSVKAFYFILGHYVERNLQYGLLHTDLTPRPAFVAFAAVGRLLNGATPIGRVDLGDEKLKAFAFKTQVDGAAKETLVAWSETDEKPVAIGAAETTYDYLGRELPRQKKVKLTRAPVFFIMRPGGSKKLIVQTPPAPAKWRDGKACPVVLQLLGATAFEQSAFFIGESKQLKLVAYNFGNDPARGTLVIEGAAGGAGEITIAPGARDERTTEVDGAGRVSASLDLGDDGKAIVSARTTTISPAQKRNK